MLLISFASAAGGGSTKDISKDEKGLLGGFFVHGEAPGKTREEINFAIKHLPSVAKDRPFRCLRPRATTRAAGRRPSGRAAETVFPLTTL